MKKLIKIGYICKSHGIYGNNIIKSYTEISINIFNYNNLFIINNKQKIYIKIIKWQIYNNNFLVKIYNINNKTESDKIINNYIYIYKNNLPLLNNNYMYINDLYNLDVIYKNIIIGIVYDIYEYKKNFFNICIYNKKNKIKYMIPLIFEIYIKDIDINSKKILLYDNKNVNFFINDKICNNNNIS